MTRWTRVWVVAVVALIGCRSQPEATTAVEPPTPQTMALAQTTGATNAVPVEEDRINVGEVQVLLDHWLAAQNDGEFAAYEALYAAPFQGVKRVGERIEEFDHAGWLADRKRMFDKPMKVSVDAVDIRVMERRATVRFVQTWSSGRYKDVGPKELSIEESDDGLRIHGEEMLRSTVGRSDKRVEPVPPTTIEKLLASATFVVASSDNVLFTPPADECGEEWEDCNDTWFQLDTEPDDVTRKTITAAQAEEYLRLLANPDTYGGTPAACYMPRLVVAFYHADETIPWATVGACIECATVGMSPGVAQIHAAMPEFESGIASGAKFHPWCESLGLTECLDDRAFHEVD